MLDGIWVRSGRRLEAMSSFRIPVMKPMAVKEEFLLPRIRSISGSGIFSNRGPQVRELETRLSAWLGVDESRLVVTSNATVALMAAISLSPAKSWHVPAWSFPATALAPLLIGKDITFVDIREEDWLVTDNRAEFATGLMNVIPFGGSFDQTAWSYPGELVIDAAASLATRPPGLNTLPESVAVVFSLHATKTMGGAEGGVVIFGSEERAKMARAWINFGFSGARESAALGTNGKMSEYDAAVANARLDGWSEEELAWISIRQQVDRVSIPLNLTNVPTSLSSISPYWIVLFPSMHKRKRAAESLHAQRIETRLWWGEGLHRMQAFAGIPSHPLGIVDNLALCYLGLPFHPALASAQIQEIAEVIHEAI